MPKPQYDRDHQLRREALLPGAIGKLCPLEHPIDGRPCGRVMLATQELDLDHSSPVATDPRSRGDRIVHALKEDCRSGGNRSAGGKLGNDRAKFAPSRKWL